MPVTLIFGVINTGILARSLGLDNYGLINIIIAITGFISGLFSAISSEALTSFITKELKNDKVYVSELIKKFYTLQVFSGIFAFLVILVFSAPLSELLGIQKNSIKYLLLYGITPIFSSVLWVLISILRLFDRYSYYFYQTLSLGLIKTIFFILIYYLGGSLTHFIYALIILQLIQSLILSIITRKVLINEGFDVGKFYSFPTGFGQEIKNYLFYNFGKSIFRSIGLYADILILSALTTSTQTVGIYKGAKRIQEILLMSLKGIESVLFPEYSKIYSRNGIIGLRNITVLTLIFTLIVGFIIAFLGYIFSHEIIIIVLGHEYIESVNTLKLLIIHAAIIFISMSLISIPKVFGDAKPNFIMSVINVIVLISLSILFVPKYSINGLVVAIIIGSLISNLYIAFISSKLLNRKTI
jgi:O-antigen/teichoic acid export membrane protein